MCGGHITCDVKGNCCLAISSVGKREGLKFKCTDMIKIENANLGDRVLTSCFEKGNIVDFSISDANRIYIDIKLDDGKIIHRPLGMCSKVNFK